MRAIAEQAGVSTGTVSLVLNGKEKGYIGAATARRVRAVACALKYRPNRMARAMVTGRTHIIQFYLPLLIDQHWAATGDLLRDMVWQDGYDLALAKYPFVDGRMGEWRGWPVDGEVISNVGPYTRPMLANARQTGMPLVVLENQPEDGNLDCVDVDLYTAASEALAHLQAQGCRRIAFVTDEWAPKEKGPRIRAYETFCHQAGMEPEYILFQFYRYPSARESMVRYLRAHGPRDRADGLFVINDQMALGVYRGLLDAGLTVGRDVALFGCDGIPEMELFDTPISTIVQPREKMCRKAWEFLRNRIGNPDHPPQRVTLRAELAFRDSTLLFGRRDPPAG